MRSSFLTILFIVSFLVSFGQKKPNIIIIYTDDMGYADVGAQGSVNDIKTSNIDKLAKTGVRFTNGYVTAPQCSPSRAGLITGRYQERYGFDSISDGPLPLSETTLASRLSKAGYITGQVGKWHLEPNVTELDWGKKAMPTAKPGKNGRYKGIPLDLVVPYMPGARGFDQYFTGYINDYNANYNLNGDLLSSDNERVHQEGYRLEIQTKAALEFVKRNHDKPFFLYLAYYGPHVPLEATQKYLDRFPGDMPERRRYALAMISAIDDGVGKIQEMLRQYQINDNTLIVFASDNGAPLKMTKEDIPISFQGGAWDGSLNNPLNGEKGMLADGGIKVPFIMSWSGLPQGAIYKHPVSTLDIAATAVALAGLKNQKKLDGIDLIPFLTGKNNNPPHDYLYWRFWNQSAVRSGKWKLLVAGNKAKFLFDLKKDPEEKNNLLEKEPNIVKNLTNKLNHWSQELAPPGIPMDNLNAQEIGWYQYYFH
jgi:arylsulfatase A-like enzyme